MCFIIITACINLGKVLKYIYKKRQNCRITTDMYQKNNDSIGQHKLCVTWIDQHHKNDVHIITGNLEIDIILQIMTWVENVSLALMPHLPICMYCVNIHEHNI